jgi:hypothetical protein
MVSSSMVRRYYVGNWETPVPVSAAGDATVADEVSYPSETPLSPVSEKTVPSIIASEESGEASSAALLIYWETPVSFTTFGGPLATTVDEISEPSKIPISASAMSEGANPLATGSEWWSEATSAALRSARFERVSPPSNSSVTYDEPPSVARDSERAKRRKPLLNASGGYDEASSVVPRSEFGDWPSLRARSPCRCRSTGTQLRCASGVDADRRVRPVSGIDELLAGAADSSSESLQSPEYRVH